MLLMMMTLLVVAFVALASHATVAGESDTTLCYYYISLFKSFNIFLPLQSYVLFLYCIYYHPYPAVAAMFKIFKYLNLGLWMKVGYEANEESVQVYHCICHRAWHHILDSWV